MDFDQEHFLEVMSTRLGKLEYTTELKDKRIIVTGCGYAPLRTKFQDPISGSQTHDSIKINGLEMKLNMGAATAAVLRKKGATVHLVSRTQAKLEQLKNYLTSNFFDLGSNPATVEYSAVDLMNSAETSVFADNLPNDKELYWFHSVGATSGDYKLPGSGNRWLPHEELTYEHLESEIVPFWKTTTNLAKSLWPRFRSQKEARAVIVSSMSAMRTYERGASHCAATAALDRLISVLTLESYQNNIWVSALRAGAIDTGTYDSEEVQQSVKQIAQTYGCNWKTGLRLAPPSSVGEAAAAIFSSGAHIPAIYLVSKGQWPHLAS